MYGQMTWQLVGLALLAAAVANPIGAVSETAHNQDTIGNYNFGYNVHHRDGQQQFRQESRDLLGRVVGSYGLAEPDGRQRVVDYVADHNGFRARVRSNEPGLQGMDSAGVRIVKPEDVPPPLLLQGTGSLGRVPYNPGGPPAQNPSRWGDAPSGGFLPLTPDKPYITQSEGLYIPPQAVDDLVYSPSGSRIGGSSMSSPLGKSRVGFHRSAKLEAPSEEDATFDPLLRQSRIEYPSSVFALPNSQERYGSLQGKPSVSFRYRVVQIPNGIQAVPEIDPSGSGSPFPSANEIFSDSGRDALGRPLISRGRPTQGFLPQDTQTRDDLITGYPSREETFTFQDQQTRDGAYRADQRTRNQGRYSSEDAFSPIDSQSRGSSESRYPSREDTFATSQERDSTVVGRYPARDGRYSSAEDSSQRPTFPRRAYGRQRAGIRGANPRKDPEDFQEYGRRISQERS